MKKIISLLIFTVGLCAQTGHTVTLTWQDTQNPTGTTYNVYRSTGLCSGTPTFSKLASAVGPMTYVDSTVIPGNYCYEVTATLNGMESAPSNTALAPVSPFPPQTLQVTIK